VAADGGWFYQAVIKAGSPDAAGNAAGSH
jgi:hypothetical protein